MVRLGAQRWVGGLEEDVCAESRGRGRASQVASAIPIQTPAETKHSRHGRDVNKWFPRLRCDREPSLRRLQDV